MPMAAASNAAARPRYAKRETHRTILIGMPSCKGSPLVVPVATMSPSCNPERMGVRTRLEVPTVTGVRTRLSPTTLKT
jgi:hypothetical protein